MEYHLATHSHHKRRIHFDSRLHIHSKNHLGAKFYKDSINRYAVKIEEQSTIFDLAPWVNFQGDCYIDQSGSTYMLTTNPYKVDRLGSLMTNLYKPKPIVRNGTRLRTPLEFSPRETYKAHRVPAAEMNGSRQETSGSLYDMSGNPKLKCQQNHYQHMCF